MTYWIGKQFGRIVSYLPAVIQKKIAELLGWLAWVGLSKIRKKTAVDNICAALNVDGEEAQKIAKASITRFGRMIITLFQYPKFTPEVVRKLVRFHGLEYLDQALAYNKGVVLVSGHCGNWELLGSSLQFLGYPMVGVVRPQRNHGFNKLIQEYRGLTGAVVLNKTDVRSIVKQLKSNRIPFILIDQNVREAGVFVQFFGRWASTPPGAAVLARLAGSPIVTAFITEAADGTHDVTFSSPLFVSTEGDKDEIVYNIMQQLTWQLEEHVRRHPDEWFWIQDRWRTKKPAEDNDQSDGVFGLN